MFNKIKLWFKKNFICSHRGHLYRNPRGHRLYYCNRCGEVDPGVLIVGKNDRYDERVAIDERLAQILDLNKKPE